MTKVKVMEPLFISASVGVYEVTAWLDGLKLPPSGGAIQVDDDADPPMLPAKEITGLFEHNC